MRWDIIWDFWIPKNPPFRLEVNQTIPLHCSLAPVLPSSKNFFKSHLTWSEQVGKEKWFHHFVNRRKPWSSCSSVLWSKGGLILHFQSHFQIFAFESPLKISGLLPPPHHHPPPPRILAHPLIPTKLLKSWASFCNLGVKKTLHYFLKLLITLSFKFLLMYIFRSFIKLSRKISNVTEENHV